jgi:hypothetical protein
MLKMLHHSNQDISMLMLYETLGKELMISHSYYEH